MSRVATIILNRNLPEPTDRLYEHLIKHDGTDTDVFVLEAGSDTENVSQYCTWHVNDMLGNVLSLAGCQAHRPQMQIRWSWGKSGYGALILARRPTSQ